MSHTQHELAEMLPQYAERIHVLKQTDRHFARLADEYHDTNRQIHRMETETEPVSDQTLESLKKTRLHLLDQLQTILAA